LVGRAGLELAARKEHRLAFDDGDSIASDLADTNLGTLQVAEDRHGLAELTSSGSNHVHARFVVGNGAVAEVEPED
jgi:hypothetical protein